MTLGRQNHDRLRVFFDVMSVRLRHIPSILILLFPAFAYAGEFHVSTHGDDANIGSQNSPFRTIQHAATVAMPDDSITVHAGTYRERINPSRGGTSNKNRIIYQSAAGEKVLIKGSEIIKGWKKITGDTWRTEVPNTFFGHFNPYKDLIRGDWFKDKGRQHHTGAVYLNGTWLAEAKNMEEVMKPSAATPLWFATVNDEKTTLCAQFPNFDPNQETVEINVRQTVFYPDQPGRNFITVRGFTMCHAATPWAPPTAEQIGLIGTHWSKGWIIENNSISHSVCTGITLGKHGDEFDNTSANSAEGYVKTIERAHAHPIPWTRENIGHHIVRNNLISHCEQAGIVGSLGAAFSTITGNVVHDIYVRKLFAGAEMAGIKLHAPIDCIISHNHIYRAHHGLWLDWMTQGTRVSANIFHDNDKDDVFLEVNHGPFLLDNNIMLSPINLTDMSQGGSYAHNLFAGKITCQQELQRKTPYHQAHSTMIAGITEIQGGDNHFLNNLFIGDDNGLQAYDKIKTPIHTSGNVFYHAAKPYQNHSSDFVNADYDPQLSFTAKDPTYTLRFQPSADITKTTTRPVTTESLGKTSISGLSFEKPDASAFLLSNDYFSTPRNASPPIPGPFEKIASASDGFVLWPLQTP